MGNVYKTQIIKKNILTKKNFRKITFISSEQSKWETDVFEEEKETNLYNIGNYTIRNLNKRYLEME